MSDRVLLIGGREYALRFDFKRVAALESRLDRDLFDCRPGDSATDLTTMAYCATSAYSDGITMDEFREMLDPVSFIDLAAKVNAALEAFLEGPNEPETVAPVEPVEPEGKKKELESGGIVDLLTGEVEGDEGPLHKGG